MAHVIELLRILGDGRFRSGVTLGRSLGISRAGVWKNIQSLRARGIEVHSVPGRGYRLAAPLELLSAEAIRGALLPATQARLRLIEVHYEVDSTNSEWLRRAAELPSGAVCLAESQLRGRGRHGRSWLSPCARNLYLSLLWRFPAGPDALGGLALIVGLAVLRTLDQAGVRGAGVKWPNDIVWRGAKLAGALIELSGETSGASTAVIGIGINVDMSQAPGEPLIDQPWTDVITAGGAAVSRNQLAAWLLQHLSGMLAQFETAGLAPFLEEWQGRDILYAQPVSIHPVLESAPEQGTARGIDPGGALLVENGGIVKRYLSGDVSIRPLAPAGSGSPA